MIHAANPRLTVKDRTNVARKIPALLEEVKEKVAEQLAVDKLSLLSAAFMTDMWTSHSNDPFISLTLHYINANFELHCWTLECCPFEESHTADNIQQHLDERITELKLPEGCLVFSTHDNGTNVALAAEKSELIEADIRCCCHTMQLAIKDAMKNNSGMEHAVEKCKKLASLVHQSSKAKKMLRNACEKKSINYRKLIAPVATRWNSEAMCMESVLHLKDVINYLAGDEEVFHSRCPSPKEWDMIEDGVTILKKFQEVSEMLSADKVPTLHEVIPQLYNLGRNGHLKEYHDCKERSTRQQILCASCFIIITISLNSLFSGARERDLPKSLTRPLKGIF